MSVNNENLRRENYNLSLLTQELENNLNEERYEKEKIENLKREYEKVN